MILTDILGARRRQKGRGKEKEREIEREKIKKGKLQVAFYISFQKID